MHPLCALLTGTPNRKYLSYVTQKVKEIFAGSAAGRASAPPAPAALAAKVRTLAPSMTRSMQRVAEAVAGDPAGCAALTVTGLAELTGRAEQIKRGRPLAGQLDAVRHHPGPLTAAPILNDALAAMECRTTAVHDGGDHSIVVGEVLAVSEPRPAGGPLLYYSSHYRRLDDAAE